MEASVLRAELADWERQFKAENGRKPTPKDAPEDVRAKYLALARLVKPKTDSTASVKGPASGDEPKSCETIKGHAAGGSALKGLSSFSTSSAGVSLVRSSATLPASKGKVFTSAAPTRVVPRPELRTCASSSELTAADALKGLVSFSSSSEGISLASCAAPLTGNKSRTLIPVASNDKPVENAQEKPKVYSYYDWVEDSSESEGDDENENDSDNEWHEEQSSAPSERVISHSSVKEAESENRPGMSLVKEQYNDESAKRPKLEPSSKSEATSSQSSLYTGKSAPNFVRMNLKKDWKPRMSQGQSKSKKEQRKRGSKWNSDDSSAPMDSNHEEAMTLILDLLEGKGSTNDVDQVPKCGHDVPCAELVVKKASTGNKGRAFYCCSLGRQASCGFFKWKDDTRAAAKKAFLVKKEEIDVPLWITKASVSDLRSSLRKLNEPAVSGKKSELLERLRSAWIKCSNNARECQASDPLEVVRDVFFHPGFLPGQKEAIERVLSRQNSLVVRATGSGKSLIYQVAAFMLPGLTLVVSPLISLIQDQISQLPPGLVGRAIIGTQKEQAEAIADAMNGVAKLLFVSPERVFSSSFQALIRRLPKISLICVDEAHCVSLWSHNFRPSYLRLGETLRKLVPEATVLALTATAALRIQREICQRLSIPFDQGGIHSTGSWIRTNLRLRVEMAPVSEDQRFAWLVSQLKNPVATEDDDDQAPLALARKDVVPTIVYTSTKNEASVLAERLSAQGFAAAPYHAALDMSERIRNQNDFLRGKIRIIVATVAFGMGLNKSDIRRVVHYRLPGSIENYVQEIGRAGRDGEPAECICLLDSSAEEARRAHSLSHSDGVEMKQLEKLIEQVSRLQANEFKTIFIDETVGALDVKESVVETLLVLLEAEDFIQLRATGYGRAKIAFGTRAPSDAFSRVLRKLVPMGSSSHSLDICQLVAECARCGLGECSVSAINKFLFNAKDSGVLSTMQLADRCFFLHRTDKPWDEGICERLKRRCDSIETRSVNCVEAVYAAVTAGLKCSDDMLGYITQYLEAEEQNNLEPLVSVPFQTFDDIAKRAFSADVRSLWRDPTFSQLPEVIRTPRAIVRILLAIPSSSFPADIWRNHRLWGRYKQYRFEDLYLEATKLVF